jgi:hypothetical protein
MDLPSVVTFLDTAAIQNSIDRKFFKYDVKMRQIAKTFEQFELKRMAIKKGHNNNYINNNNYDKRICNYCGWNMDESDIELLIFFHSDCWKEYRKDGLVYPMPENV